MVTKCVTFDIGGGDLSMYEKIAARMRRHDKKEITVSSFKADNGKMVEICGDEKTLEMFADHLYIDKASFEDVIMNISEVVSVDVTKVRVVPGYGIFAGKHSEKSK